MQFSDGNKFRDIIKMFIFASHNVLAMQEGSTEYALLCVIRKYLDMVMWEMLEVHTSKTIECGRQAVEEFGDFINAYDDHLYDLSRNLPVDTGSEPSTLDPSDDDTSSNDSDSSENGADYQSTQEQRGRKFNFPKLHHQVHAFDDIEAKGPLWIYSTRLFEARHRSLKLIYQITNYKNIAPQILRIELRKVVAQIIRAQIDWMKEAKKQGFNAESLDFDIRSPSLEQDVDEDVHLYGNIYLGSPEKPTSLEAIDALHQGDHVFRTFRERTLRRLKELLSHQDSKIVLTCKFSEMSASLHMDSNTVTQYKFIKPTYESLVDWRAHTDYLRAHPTYHKVGRFDYVLVHNEPRNYFAQMVSVFTIKIGAQFHRGDTDVFIPLALVIPFAEVKQVRKKDKDLRLIRIRPEKEARIIPARSIIRGAYVVPEGSGSETCLVVDVIDSDMFLRMQQMFPDSHR
ncbi:hypothetical protein H0H92_008417 [Tricholoma furcatifolium]|nr:hypothetical protein H0H92_008417 [Tricholoma furcatifolium]